MNELSNEEWRKFRRDCPKRYAPPHGRAELCVHYETDFVQGQERSVICDERDCDEQKDCPRLKGKKP